MSTPEIVVIESDDEVMPLWSCEVCTLKNIETFLACVTCGSPRASHDDEILDVYQASAGAFSSASNSSSSTFYRAKLLIEEDARLAAELEAIEQREVRTAAQKRKVEFENVSLSPSCHPALLAGQLCEQLRGDRIHEHGSVVNYDHTIAFLEYHKREVAASRDESARILILYHGTRQPKNFRSIIDGNLRVPDGVNLQHATDDGYFGKGIYTSPNFQTSLAYAGTAGVIFVCLALPGRQYTANMMDRGRPCQHGFNSHISPNGEELVFFNSAQLLPIYLAGNKDMKKAQDAAERAITTIARGIGNKNPRGPGIQKHQYQRQEDPEDNEEGEADY